MEHNGTHTHSFDDILCYTKYTATRLTVVDYLLQKGSHTCTNTHTHTQPLPHTHTHTAHSYYVCTCTHTDTHNALFLTATYLQFIFPLFSLAAHPLHDSVGAAETVGLAPVDHLRDWVVNLKQVVVVMLVVVVHVLHKTQRSNKNRE